MHTDDRQWQDLIAEQAAQWYVAHRDGTLGTKQQNAFVHWLRASPMHVAEYLAIAGVARDIADAAPRDTTPLPQLLGGTGGGDRVVPIHAVTRESVFDRYSPHEHRARVRARYHRHTRSRAYWGKVAALALVATAMVLGLRWFVSRPQVQYYATGHGEQRSLQLPDNTFVRLNSDSAIAVSFSPERRLVEVTRGQAYFEVAKDPLRPFGVRVGSLLIRDIGTAFDVYRQDASTTVTVTEGQVQVWPMPPAPRSFGWLHGGQPARGPHERPLVDLLAGHQARIGASGVIESQGPADVDLATAWLQGNIVFEDQSIASVAAQFNRYNNAQISVRDPRIGALPISGTFAAHDVSTFVAFLGSMRGVHTQMRGRRIIVSGVAARKHRD
ncbi:MAG: FecR domain-containing protein [Xanthomonadaceae bacterium]|nr:FecR domain-containing protein [Xanthomonadaceae bacterium]MDE2248993.1 FecR domain-containing protein [Xanthomonadaceae bacterium]